MGGREGFITLAAAAVTVCLAISVRGDWLLLAVFIWKQLQDDPGEVSSSSSSPGPPAHTSVNASVNTSLLPAPEPAWREQFAGVHWFILGSVTVSYVTYFSLTGFLQWFYYIRQKDAPEVWKCQPGRWLSAADERHEVILGSLIMGMGGVMSGIVACYVLNGGYSTLYFSVSERGWPYLLTSLLLVFVVQDCLGYHLHRMYHIPLLYRNIHKWHHRYHSPTAFSGTAMHPLEFLTYHASLMSPIFTIPIHAGAYICFLCYVYYYGIIDHSGIKMAAVWPWQPHSMFHDDHHRYFHTNFGFNMSIWDRMYGTLRRKDREYGEGIFGGKGRVKTS